MPKTRWNWQKRPYWVSSADLSRVALKHPPQRFCNRFSIRGRLAWKTARLFVYDADGRWIATTEKIDIAGLNNSDRTYFKHHRTHDDKKTVLGDPVRSRSGGQWVITVSKRFNQPDGSFGGVVLATSTSILRPLLWPLRPRAQRLGGSAERARPATGKEPRMTALS